jgi:hypothetical protein
MLELSRAQPCLRQTGAIGRAVMGPVGESVRAARWLVSTGTQVSVPKICSILADGGVL